MEGTQDSLRILHTSTLTLLHFGSMAEVEQPDATYCHFGRSFELACHSEPVEKGALHNYRIKLRLRRILLTSANQYFRYHIGGKPQHPIPAVPLF